MNSEQKEALSTMMSIVKVMNNNVGGPPKKEMEKVEQVIEYIKNSNPEWIPISKAVPPVIGYYLTTTMDNEVFCDVWNGDRFNREETVIAWMEKPDPYVWRNDDE